MVCWISFFCSCSDSDGNNADLPSLSHAFIVCEGNYGSHNATLSILDSVEADTTFNNVFETVNRRKLGDHAHGMLVADSLGFIAVTGSDRIELINTRTYESIESIDLIRSPRNIALYNGQLLITSYEDSAVVALSFSTRSKDFVVKLMHRPDEIAVLNNKAYVSSAPNLNDSVISVIDLTTHFVDTIILGKNPVSLAVDAARNRIYAACSGAGSAGFIAVIDGSSGALIEKIGEFNNIRPVKLALQDSLLAYIVSSNGLIRVYNLEQAGDVSSISGNYHALAFGNGELFATDGLDFISNGDLIWFGKNFQVRRKYKVGRVPANIVFKE
jgi:DNA-binding beta-propeller fold protein YncE